MIGLAKRSQRERIGRGPIEDKENFAFGFEDVPDEV